MKKKLVVAAAVLLSGSLMFSSCIGSFGLTRFPLWLMSL